MILLFVTVSVEHSSVLAEKIVSSRLAACVNIVPRIKSLYWWRNKIEHDEEALLLIKTSRYVEGLLREFIEKEHPYEVPEIVSVRADNVNDAYLQWIVEEVTSVGKFEILKSSLKLKESEKIDIVAEDEKENFVLIREGVKLGVLKNIDLRKEHSELRIGGVILVKEQGYMIKKGGILYGGERVELRNEERS